MRINNNISALNAWRNLNTSNTQMGKSLEKLSSGFRINRAADDASGLVISQSLRAQISGLKQATRNAQDGISLVQTAEGALSEVHSMLNRMRDLAVQSGNTATMDSTAISAAQDEYNALSAEIGRIATSTSFGEKKLLDGSMATTTGTGTAATASSGTATATGTSVTVGAGGESFNVTVGSNTYTATIAAGTYADADAQATALQAAIRGAHSSLADATVTNASGTLTFASPSGVNFTAADTTLTGGAASATGGTAAVAGAVTGGATFQVGAYSADKITIGISAVTTGATGLDIDGLQLTDAAGTITKLDAAIKSVSKTRGELGAIQNRFESTINNLQVTTENLTASESRIRDVDMASEMTQFTKQQVLLQAGTSMLGQANGLSQSVLSLLQ